ncbi:MAG: sugar ABC transporter ATP-binding protein, partial [Mesorhizobium sp.]
VYHPIHAERQVIKGIDINVRKGEVVGIAGLMGAGRTEFAMSLFGRSYGRRVTGEVLLKGKPIDVSSVSKAVEHGIAYVTEDRKTYGLNLIDHIKHNITLANLPGVSRHSVIDDMRELAVANDYKAKTNIRSSSVYQMTGNLSGGNQQKVMVGRWMSQDAKLFILDEPFQGVDISARRDIAAKLRASADGRATLLFVTELDRNEDIDLERLLAEVAGGPLHSAA